VLRERGSTIRLWHPYRNHASKRSRTVTNAESGQEQEKEVYRKEKLVNCTFQMARTVEFGSDLLVVGDAYGLGQWEATDAPILMWTPGDVWSCQVAIPEGTQVAFKFVLRSCRNELQWESFRNNRQVIVPSEPVVITANWGDESLKVEAEEKGEENGEADSVEVEGDEERVEGHEEGVEGQEETLTDMPSKVKLALSEIVQASSSAKAVGFQGSGYLDPQGYEDFEESLLMRLEILRPTLDESGSAILDDFVLEVVKVARKGITWRDDYYKDVVQKKQEDFERVLAVEAEKVVKLTEEISKIGKCDLRDEEMNKFTEAELMFRLSRAELLAKITRVEMKDKMRELERSLASETEKTLQLTKIYDQVKMTQLTKVTGLESALGEAKEKVRELERALADKVQKTAEAVKYKHSNTSVEDKDNSAITERIMAEKRVLTEKLTVESTKVDSLKKQLAELEKKVGDAEGADVAVLLARARAAEATAGKLNKECAMMKQLVAEQFKKLEASRTNMAWRDNLYQTKLQKAEEGLHKMKVQDEAKWVAFKQNHEFLMEIMRKSNAALEIELMAARADVVL